jgi:primosomal protein N'
MEVQDMKTALCSFSESSPKLYSYIIPPDLADAVVVGSRVVVPKRSGGESIVYVQRLEKKPNKAANVTMLRLAEEG